MPLPVCSFEVAAFRRMPSKKETVWHRVTLTLHPCAAELANSLLFSLGTTGTRTIEESEEVLRLEAYFPGSTSPGELIESLEAGLRREGQPVLTDVSVSTIPDQDWLQEWKQGYEPVWIGRRIVVAPSWKLPSDIEGRVVVQIDPGMAFGTGTHETTRLCLEAIERYWDGGTLLDVGTGTGVLAITAALLRPNARVTAIDIDPLAVKIARENIAINRVSDRVTAVEGLPRQFAGREFDLVVANLTAEVIVDSMTDLDACLRCSGSLILSGILTELRPSVERSVREIGLTIVEGHDAGEWSAVVARK